MNRANARRSAPFTAAALGAAAVSLTGCAAASTMPDSAPGSPVTVTGVGPDTRTVVVPAKTVGIKPGASCTGPGSITWTLSPSNISSQTACTENTSGYGLITLETGYPENDEPTLETVTVNAPEDASWSLTFTFLTTPPGER